MLKKVKIELGGQALELSAISALDYLDYVEYISEMEKPEPVRDSDTEIELNRKLNRVTRNNLISHARLIAFSLSYNANGKTVDELQQEILTTWTHSDVFLALGAVQDVCGFPKMEIVDSDNETKGELKNA